MSNGLEITVKLYGILQRHRPPPQDTSVNNPPHQPFVTYMPSGSTVNDLISHLGIDDDFVLAIAVNGDSAGYDSVLQDGAQVNLFPPAAGG